MESNRASAITEQKMRTFPSGATRDSNKNKLEYARFLDPGVLRRYAEYMHEHRKQADGKLRDPDNWKKGIPLEVYRDSSMRHFMERWEVLEDLFLHIKNSNKDDEFLVLEKLEEILCAELFNVFGSLYEVLKMKQKI